MAIFEGMSIEEMLKLYSVLHGGSSPDEENKLLNEELRRAVHLVDPEYEIKPDLTSYEAFLLVSKVYDTTDTFSNIEGYSENVWSFLSPLNDEDDCSCENDFNDFTHEEISPFGEETSATQDILHEENVQIRRNDIDSMRDHI